MKADRNKMKILLSLLAIFLFTACSNKPVKSYPFENEPYIDRSSSKPRPQTLDLAQLELVLQMDRQTSELGMTEKKFNSCDAISLLPQSHPCRDLHFSVYHFQLVCRDSVGTVQEAAGADLTPIASKEVRWKMGRNGGVTITDNEGYGRIRVLTEKSQKDQMFILKLNSDMLGVRAREVRKFIVPHNWCS